MRPKALLKKQTFERRSNLSAEKIFWPILSSFIELDKSQATTYKCTQVFFDKNYAIDMIIFLGPNRSTETKISKNRCFHGDKRFWSTFPGIIECDQPQGTFCNGQKVCWQLIWKLKGISVTPETLLKTQILKKEKAIFPVKNFFGLFFQKLQSRADHRKQSRTVSKAFRHFLCKL